MFFYGSRSKNGVGGVVSPSSEKYYSTFRFTFSCTNNTRKYEASVHGLQWTKKRGISSLQVFGDRRLIVN